MCLVLVLALGVMGGGVAYFSDTTVINVTLTAGHWERGGTPGFWENWDSHKTYAEDEILDFLADISDASLWLGDITDIRQMEAVFAAGEAEDATMEAKFLRQYLATRLNVEADRLRGSAVHDLSGCDPGSYLGLGGQGTLWEIIAAIEGKYGTPPPTDDEFEIMKDICDALNNLAI